MTGDKPESPFRTGRGVADKARGGGEGRDAKAVGDSGGDTVGVSTVVVDEGGKAGDFRGEKVIGGLRIDGVVEVLEGVSEKNDELNAWVSGDCNVDVASRHAVELINDETTGALEERNLK